jgi:hypothetical protein
MIHAITGNSNERWIDPGANCFDHGKDISDPHLMFELNVQAKDLEDPGTYLVKYSCKDSTGLQAKTVTRTVVSVEAPHKKKAPAMPVCDALQLVKCKPLALHGPKCVDCIKNLHAACSTKQMDLMCWASGNSDGRLEREDDHFDMAVREAQAAKEEEAATGVPADCQLSGWSHFSPCSTTCGKGFQIASRSVVTAASSNGGKCEEKLDTIKACKDAPSCSLPTPSPTPSFKSFKEDEGEGMGSAENESGSESEGKGKSKRKSKTVCDALQLVKCKPLALHGPKCVDCIKNLPAACSTKQMDAMCWARGNGVAEKQDDHFDSAVELAPKPICDAMQLIKCKPLMLGGPRCANCIAKLPAACSTKQIDAMCYVRNDKDGVEERFDDHFASAVKLAGNSA